MLHLVEPDPQYARSHASYIAEFNAADEPLVPWILAKAGDDFEAYVQWLQQQADPRSGDTHFVANSSFWLLDGDEIVAVSNMRHCLTPALKDFGGHIGYSVRPSQRGCGHAKLILSLTLHRLSLQGVARARITCDKHNVASAAVIVANGGVLDSEALVANRMVQRYWIEIA